MPTKIKKAAHTHVVPKNTAKDALKAAKELERLPLPTDKEIVKLYKEGLEEARKLQKLLTPEWFVEDTDAQGRASPDAYALKDERLHAALLREKKHPPLLKTAGKRAKKK